MIDTITEALIPGSYRVGIHVRVGGNWFDQADVEAGMPGRPPAMAERAVSQPSDCAQLKRGIANLRGRCLIDHPHAGTVRALHAAKGGAAATD